MQLSRLIPVWPTFLVTSTFSMGDVMRELTRRAQAAKAGDFKTVVGGRAPKRRRGDDTLRPLDTLSGAMARQADCGELREILAGGADITQADDGTGWTALHWAAYWGRPDTVAFLLAAGADPHALDARGFPPICLLRHLRQEADTVESLRLLLQAGPRPNAQGLLPGGVALRTKFREIDGVDKLLDQHAPTGDARDNTDTERAAIKDA